MKKIIALLVLFFAFSINATAQDKTAQIEQNAKKDIEALVDVVKVDVETETALYRLFKKKHEGMLAENTTTATKSQISTVIEAKLRATLTADQMIALEGKKAVFAQLISGTPSTEIKAKK